MKIHYISNHSILEYDEIQLFTDMGHDVFSNGAYLDPAGHFSLPRPAIRGMKYNSRLADIARVNPKTNLPDDLIDPFDVIIVMHQPDVIVQNWDKLKHKTVIWRTIGQSVAGIERMLKPMRDEGLKIVRYSLKEKNIKGYIGGDAMIRFYKDPEEYKGWTGEDKVVVNFSQSLKGRRGFCHYDEIMAVIEHFDGKVYGPGNDDLGAFNGGDQPYENQMAIMKQSRAMIYGGTWPASYTLSFIEALMLGLPIVAISKALAHYPNYEPFNFYEVDELLARIGGIVCDTPEQMIKATQRLLDDEKFAKEISEKQRTLALTEFGKEKIKSQWEDFLNGLNS